MIVITMHMVENIKYVMQLYDVDILFTCSHSRHSGFLHVMFVMVVWLIDKGLKITYKKNDPHASISNKIFKLKQSFKLILEKEYV